MKVLVTGGGGFIGSHLVDLLLQRGHAVRVLDNFSTGRRSNLPQAHIDLEIMTADIRNADEVFRGMDGVDAVVHLAAVASVQASVEDPVGTHEVNLVGTLNLLEAARRKNVSRFVFASSAAVYGNTQSLPVAERAALQPLTPYAADKLASEYYIDFYHRQYALQPTVFRFFNIFGPRQDPSSPYSGVISIFMQRAIDNLPITVFGDGRQSRDFVFVADLVRLLADCLERSTSFPTANNVGNGKQTDLLELLEVIGSLSGRELQVVYEDPRPGDIRHSCADNRLLKERMGYVQQHSVADGLKTTYDWYLQGK